MVSFAEMPSADNLCCMLQIMQLYEGGGFFVCLLSSVHSFECACSIYKMFAECFSPTELCIFRFGPLVLIDETRRWGGTRQIAVLF